VEYFDALEGVDSEILAIINERIAETKARCDKRVVDHIKY
jgi:hypothetical protein